MALWRRHLEQVATTQKGTTARRLALAAAAGSLGVSPMTVRRALGALDDRGEAGLYRPSRCDKGSKRAITWLKLDGALRVLGLTDQDIVAKVRDPFVRAVRSHFAAFGRHGLRTVAWS